jgi:hypothetical protein
MEITGSLLQKSTSMFDTSMTEAEAEACLTDPQVP